MTHQIKLGQGNTLVPSFGEDAACSVLQLSWPYLDVQQVYSLPEESDLALYSCDHSQNFDWLIVGQGDGSTAHLDPRGKLVHIHDVMMKSWPHAHDIDIVY